MAQGLPVQLEVDPEYVRRLQQGAKAQAPLGGAGGGLSGAAKAGAAPLFGLGAVHDNPWAVGGDGFGLAGGGAAKGGLHGMTDNIDWAGMDKGGTGGNLNPWTNAQPGLGGGQWNQGWNQQKPWLGAQQQPQAAFGGVWNQQPPPGNPLNAWSNTHNQFNPNKDPRQAAIEAIAQALFPRSDTNPYERGQWRAAPQAQPWAAFAQMQAAEKLKADALKGVGGGNKAGEVMVGLQEGQRRVARAMGRQQGGLPVTGKRKRRMGMGMAVTGVEATAARTRARRRRLHRSRILHSISMCSTWVRSFTRRVSHRAKTHIFNEADLFVLVRSDTPLGARGVEFGYGQSVEEKMRELALNEARILEGAAKDAQQFEDGWRKQTGLGAQLPGAWQ